MHVLVFVAQGCGQSSGLMCQRSMGNGPAGPQVQIGAEVALRVAGTEWPGPQLGWEHSSGTVPSSGVFPLYCAFRIPLLLSWPGPDSAWLCPLW